MLYLQQVRRLFLKIVNQGSQGTLFAFVFLFISLMGCRSMIDEPFSIEDCPKVVSTFPLNAAVSVNENSTLKVKFNKLMLGSTFNAETFQLFLGTTPIAGKITFKDSTVSFTPTQLLESDKNFTAKINHGVKDISNNFMLGSYDWSFATQMVSPTAFPAITSTDPENLATAVPFNKKISVIFNKKMDSLSIISSFTLFNTTLGGANVLGSVSYSGTTAVFTPEVLLPANTTYTGIISKTSKDLQGNSLPATYMWNFTTGANQDLTAPEIVGTEPFADALNVPLNKKISVLFSETMDPSTLNSNTFIVQNSAGEPVLGLLTYSGITAIITPNSTLMGNTRYSVRVENAKDLAGNSLEKAYSWFFTTGIIPDKTPAKVISTDPIHLATQVTLDKNISVVFNENMDPATMTTDNFTLQMDGLPVTGCVKSVGATTVFDPTVDLIPFTTYVATISKEVMDLSGNKMTDNYTWSFKTGADLIDNAPTVVSTDPGHKATQVAIDKVISIRFVENMDPSTINLSSVKLSDGKNSIVGTVSSNGSFASFTPTEPLLVNTTYYATVTNGVKNLSGKNMLANYSWTFTTAANIPVYVAPSILYVDPDRDAINVDWDKSLTIKFSEDMKASSINTDNIILKLGATVIPGVVTVNGSQVIFNPSITFTPNTTYTAMVSTRVQSLTGTNMSSNYVWSFKTAPLPVENIRPYVMGTDPTSGAQNVVLDKLIAVAFSENMDPASINYQTFTLRNGNNSVPGTVASNGIYITFDPTNNLQGGLIYTGTVTTGVRSLAGKYLEMKYEWSFMTYLAPVPPVDPPIIPPSGPELGAISAYGSFGGGAGITNQGTNTIINGKIGTTGASTLITGFHDVLNNNVYTETLLNMGAVTDGIFTAPPMPGTLSSSIQAQQAASDALLAYNSISPASKPGGIDPGAGELGGLTLEAGVYKAAGGSFSITNGNLVLDGKGNPNATWIFQAPSSLTVGVAGPSGAKSVTLINGASAKNVFWYVGSAATINGAGGGTMVGTILASAGVTFSTAGNVVQTVLNGRAIGLNASVTMVNTTITVPQ